MIARADRTNFFSPRAQRITSAVALRASRAAGATGEAFAVAARAIVHTLALDFVPVEARRARIHPTAGVAARSTRMAGEAGNAGPASAIVLSVTRPATERPGQRHRVSVEFLVSGRHPSPRMAARIAMAFIASGCARFAFPFRSVTITARFRALFSHARSMKIRGAGHQPFDGMRLDLGRRALVRASAHKESKQRGAAGAQRGTGEALARQPPPARAQACKRHPPATSAKGLKHRIYLPWHRAHTGEPPS